MIVFIVPFVSPHTLPLGKELAKYQETIFINTIALTEERRHMGYDITDENVKMYNLYNEYKLCMKLIDEAECVIFACSFGFDVLKNRLRENKLIFIMHERIFKKGIIKWLDKRTFELLRFCKTVRKKNVYLLSLGEKAAKDFKLLGFNEKKIFRFGYFPATEKMIERLKKNEDTCNILWVGRMVGFKRPILAIKAMKGLPENYKLTMIGDGVLYKKVKKYAKRNSINVEFYGNKEHEFVINKMREADILLSTSNKGEGWGAVINEGMNCGCAIVCSTEIGCADTLVNPNNSIMFKGNLASDVRIALLEAKKNIDVLSSKAQDTIEKAFNPTVAAERFLQLVSEISNGVTDTYSEGICSKSFM